MNAEEIRFYCLSKKGVSECFPFDQKTLVFKLANKMFALTDVESFSSMNLKCEPEKAVLLREQFDGIQPGFHMNKKHWNTVQLNGGVPPNLLRELIDDSYRLVYNSLTKKQKNTINSNHA